jgi:hypothetical protein
MVSHQERRRQNLFVAMRARAMVCYTLADVLSGVQIAFDGGSTRTDDSIAVFPESEGPTSRTAFPLDDVLRREYT